MQRLALCISSFQLTLPSFPSGGCAAGRSTGSDPDHLLQAVAHLEFLSQCWQPDLRINRDMSPEC